MSTSGTGSVDLPTSIRVMLVGIGIAAAVAGAVAVFQGDDGAGSAALITIGLGLVALGLLAGHVTSFRAGGIEIETIRRRQAESALRDLIAAMAPPLGAAYRAIRENIDAGPERTQLMTEYFDVVARQAPFSHFDRAEVEALFRQGGEGDRIVALALMWGDPSTVSVDCVLDGIADSRSAFEQSRALWIAERGFAGLTGPQRMQLQGAIERGRRHIGDDASRSVIVARLDEQLDSSGPSSPARP